MLIQSYVESFKSVDVENSDKLVRLVGRRESVICLTHDPVEQTRVHKLR
jgi:hypothetical protein